MGRRQSSLENMGINLLPTTNGTPVALVTGATGFVGSALVKRLLRQGVKVNALTSGRTQKSRLEQLHSQVNWFPFDPEGLAKAVENVTHFFNFSVRYDIPEYTDADIHHVNVTLPLRIISALAQAQRPVTCIMGDTFFRKFPNNATKQPRYTASKKQFKYALASELWPGHPCQVAMLVIEQVYGPGENLIKAYPRIIKELLKNTPRIPLTPGSQGRDFIHIEDVIDAAIVAANSTWRGLIDVGCGSGTATPVKLVFEFLKNLCQSQSELGFGDIPHDQAISNSVANIEWLTHQGWKPTVSLENGLFDLVCDVRGRSQ